MARQWRQLSYIVEFTSDMRHIKGLVETVIDTPSRLSEEQPVGEAAGVASISLVSSFSLLLAGIDYERVATRASDLHYNKGGTHHLQSAYPSGSRGRCFPLV
jgi:hypothetical protein